MRMQEPTCKYGNPQVQCSSDVHTPALTCSFFFFSDEQFPFLPSNLFLLCRIFSDSVEQFPSLRVLYLLCWVVSLLRQMLSREEKFSVEKKNSLAEHQYAYKRSIVPAGHCSLWIVASYPHLHLTKFCSVSCTAILLLPRLLSSLLQLKICNAYTGTNHYPPNPSILKNKIIWRQAAAALTASNRSKKVI